MFPLLATFIGLLIAFVGLIVAWRVRRGGVAWAILGACVVWAVIYFGILFAVSFTSEERILAPGEEMAFCGFYIDCHLHASVTDVVRTRTLGNAPDARVARGMFHLVTLRIASDARRATLEPSGITATVVDDAGRTYTRSLELERVLEESEGGTSRALEQPVGPESAYTRRLVFDLPEDVRGASLLVTEGDVVERLLELFIIGDEDSLLHRRTRLRLEPQM